MPKINSLLFVQHREVIEKQRGEVERAIRRNLGLTVTFASSPEEVSDGSDYDVVIAPTVPWLHDLLIRLPRLRWVHFLSAGVEKIWDMDFDWTSVVLSKSSGVHAAPMSEYALGAMLYFAKEFNRYVETSRHKRWDRTWLSELTEKNLVIIGMGSVGSAVADRADAFGMNVLGIATKGRLHEKHKVQPVEELYESLAYADYIVVTVPLTRQTQGLGNEKFFTSVKPGAVLVDISRGGVIQSSHLIAALESGRLRGVAVDVFEEEPLEPTSSLWNRNDVLLTPHVAGTTPHYLSRALDIFIGNARAFLRGRPLETAVDPVRGY